ncbi:hypothetical protein [Candidatus Electronema sp. JC]|uniref:hypothetical protein n=1 Tax=Candidatus Electronema sp. JC TaxID=3401570 RepID=UPI003B43A396
MSPDRKKLLRILLIVGAVDLLIAAGAAYWWLNRQAGPPPEKEEAQLAAPFVNLSAAVEVYFSDLPEDAPEPEEQEILRRSAAHDPRLLEPFTGWPLRVRQNGRHALLLLCTKDGRHALLEDAGCTPQLDRRAESGQPCDFTLRVEDGCRVTSRN